MERAKINLISWLTLFLLGSIWGSSFILMKIGTRAFSTLELSSLRMFFGGIFAIPFLIIRWRKYERETLGWMFFSAMLGSAIPSILYAYSASKLDSNINGVINSLTPLFTLIAGMIWLKYRANSLSIAGIIIGFIGVSFLFTQKSSSLLQIKYSFFPFLAAFMYGINMNLVKVKLSHLPSMDILFGVFGLLGLLYLPIILYLGVFDGLNFKCLQFNFWEKSTNIEFQKVLSLEATFILGSVGSFLASLIFYKLLKQTNALFASTNTYIIPLMSIFWGYKDGEIISWEHFMSLFIILFGVYLVSLRS